MNTPFALRRRAARASAALRGMPTNGRPSAYYNHSRRSEWSQIPEDGIADLLSDIRHLCDLLNLDFAQLDAVAYRHYADECINLGASRSALQSPSIERQDCACSYEHSNAAGVIEACLRGRAEGSDESWTGF